MDDKTYKELLERCSILIGQKPWKVFRSVGSYLLMEMGNRLEYEFRGQKRYQGEICLWLNGCGWIVDKDGEVIFGCLDKSVDEKIKIFTDATIESISIERTRPGLDAVFGFSGNLNLRTFCDSINENDLGSWLVRDPSGRYLQMGPGNKWTYGED